jgi:hemerythrin-like metal-binding protein
MNQAIVGRMGLVQIKACMQAILDDAAMHFAHEEVLFRKWNYPDAEQHTSRHVEIMQALHGIMGNLVHGGLEYELVEAGLKVKAVLIEHLLTDDMKYRDYCCASGRCGSGG